MEDREIIMRYLSGRDDIVEILIDRYKAPLYKLCCHLTEKNMDADDLFQDTWVKAIKNIKRYDADKPFIPWLYVICTNLYKDRYRSRKRWLGKIKEYFDNEQKDDEMDAAGSLYPLTEDELIEKYDRDTIRKYVNKLDDTYRLPIILYYFKEIEYGDIGDILGIPLGTVKSRIYGAKQKLRKLMEVDKYER